MRVRGGLEGEGRTNFGDQTLNNIRREAVEGNRVAEVGNWKSNMRSLRQELSHGIINMDFQEVNKSELTGIRQT